MQLAAYVDMSLEELASIEVTSVSRKAERLADAPASIFVITSEDIRRSGFTTLPDVLRLAPNLQVAQTSASVHAISARGFNGSANSAPNKLLVLIDGRSIYSPLFAGVFWDTQDVMLEDVDRIEVISGPGSTMWGVNAVNGVINIITRTTQQTQGTLLTATAGNLGADVAARYGGRLGDDGSYRVYAKQSDRDHFQKASGDAVNDGWHRRQAGFRADWMQRGDKFFVAGNAYDGTMDQPAPGTVSVTGVAIAPQPIAASGVNLTGRWDHELENGGSVSFQSYFDQSRRDIRPYLNDVMSILDFQVQHSLPEWGRHQFVWGANYRYADDQVTNRFPQLGFFPPGVQQKWISVFAQDEIRLTDELKLTLGARVERNPYTGNDFLPSARLAWKPAEQHLLWSAVSRTVRAPSRLDRDFYIRQPAQTLNGGPTLRSEVAKVVEFGYRGQVTPEFSYSVTRYRAEYDQLQTVRLVSLTPVVIDFASDMAGRANGLEMWGSYQVNPRWRLNAGMTQLKETLISREGNVDASATNAVGRNPSRSWQIRSSLNLPWGQELDIGVRRVFTLDRTVATSATPADIPAYTAIDARLGWKVGKTLSVSIAGTNLLGTRHPEFGEWQYRAIVPTGVSLKLLWQM